MKSSQLDEARRLVETEIRYRTMLDYLHGYPGFDAVLEVNGKRLMISRDQANDIIRSYQRDNERKMEDLGLEVDE